MRGLPLALVVVGAGGRGSRNLSDQWPPTRIEPVVSFGWRPRG